MRNLAAWIGAACVLTLGGCGQEEATGEEPAVSTGAAEDEVTAPELSAEEASALAFRAAWEAAAPVTAADPRASDEDDNRWPEPVEGSFEFREGQVVQLATNQYALISSGYVEGAGHSTAGALAIHYLRRDGDGFRRIEIDPMFIAGGSGGQAPTFEVRRDLTPSPAVVVSSGMTNQGETCVVGSVVELTPSHPVLRAIEMPLAHEASDGEGNWTGELAAGRRGRDFAIQYSGASDARASWILTDIGLYRAASEPRLPGC
jgi:hypothetical protein